VLPSLLCPVQCRDEARTWLISVTVLFHFCFLHTDFISLYSSTFVYLLLISIVYIFSHLVFLFPCVSLWFSCLVCSFPYVYSIPDICASVIVSKLPAIVTLTSSSDHLFSTWHQAVSILIVIIMPYNSHYCLVKLNRILVLTRREFQTEANKYTTNGLSVSLYLIIFLYHHLRCVHSTAVFLHPKLSFAIRLCL
jgi:hypothetical protein